MASKTREPLAPWAVRQLRRTRSIYVAGIAVWAAGAGLEGWQHPGSREMWVFVLFLVVFTGLLSMTSWWLWRHQTALRLEQLGRACSKGNRRAAVREGAPV
ncbi:hypothetical protein [Streptomyces sp. NPDC055287]